MCAWTTCSFLLQIANCGVQRQINKWWVFVPNIVEDTVNALITQASGGVNGLHLYSTFIQSALQFMPLIHPFTHQRRLAAMQGTNQLVRSNWGLGVLLRDTSTRPGWDWTGNPPTARRQLLPPEPYRPRVWCAGLLLDVQQNLTFSYTL